MAWKCPDCQGTTKVVNGFGVKEYNRLRRCQSCGAKIYTTEVVATADEAFLKKVQSYSRHKKYSYLSRDTWYYDYERRLTVCDTRTHKLLLVAEGRMKISDESESDLEFTIRTGPNSYKKNRVRLTDHMTYVIEDINGDHDDPYHYTLTVHAKRNNNKEKEKER